jgi:hypothetical protein
MSRSSVRRLKARAYTLRNTQTWDTSMTKMHFIRHIKPCSSYVPWCSDCNGNLFRALLGRFPYSVAEFDDFQDVQQANATPYYQETA